MIKISVVLGALGLLCLPALAPAQHQTYTFVVDGVCGMCKERIEKAALQVPGVRSASWNTETHQFTAEVRDGKVDEMTLHRKISGVGHDTDKLKASDEAYNSLHACCKYRDTAIRNAHQPKAEGAAAEPVPAKMDFFVDGICGMCKERIEKTARQSPGVKSATWNADTRQLTVVSDPATFDDYQLLWNLAGAGHDTEKLKAPDAMYNRLPDCCRYRDAKVRQEHQPSGQPGESKKNGNDPDFFAGGVWSTESEQQVEAKLQTPAITGTVFQENGKGESEPLTGVNVFWAGSNLGTVTDLDGHFQLATVAGSTMLVASYVGFRPDTLDITGKTSVTILLAEALTLEEVEVVNRKRSTEFSFLEPVKVQMIGEGELLKAACCNLSESFETNPSVDVSFTDAVTGTRQIEMLGLAGPYVQVTRENMPDIRGLTAIYGLTHIPGPWIEGIQLIKGAGSVVNGYESIAGQINVELRKPEQGDRLYLNIYANEGGRLEGNANLRHSFNDRWHTGLLLHGKTLQSRMDRNGDGFLDNPLGDQLMAVNRWKYTGPNGLSSQFGVRATYVDNLSGQLNFAPGDDRSSEWGAGMTTRRLEGWAKIGKVFASRPGASIGFQVSGSYHDQDAFFGLRDYDADQRTIYSNLIYQGLLGDTRHQFKTGVSFLWDNYHEQFSAAAFDRNEIVPGVFYEYSFIPNEKFTAVAGLRADYHNIFGLFVTPRIHLRYALSEFTILRATGGRGQRTASIFAENIGALASSRQLIIDGPKAGSPYGLDAEVAWNAGLNLTQEFRLGPRPVLLSLDAYHTRFENQIIADYDQSPQELHFYNLDGVSYSNSIQAQVDYEVLLRWNLRLAYRFNDVQMTFKQGQMDKPFVARHRAFLNTAYATGNDWKFDLTINWQGAKRLPPTASNPAEYQRPERSPDFVLVNTQISKTWKEKIEIYLGVENLFDFVQPDPIIAADAPFGPYFDSSLVWGPVFGRMAYTGIRWRLP